MLGQSYGEGGEGFSGRCPIPDAVLGEVTEVFFEYNFTVFEDDKGFGVFLVEVVVEAVDIGIAPSQTLGRCGFPCAGIWREVGGLCRCFLWGDEGGEGGEGDDGYPSGGEKVRGFHGNG